MKITMIMKIMKIAIIIMKTYNTSKIAAVSKLEIPLDRKAFLWNTSNRARRHASIT
jgi:hypothetical protein